MSNLNLLAMSRASTMYLPELRAMMFPAILTNTLFSIEPNKRTAVFTVSFRIDEKGDVADYKIRTGFVEKVQKLTYEQTDALIDNSVSPSDPLYKFGEDIRKINSLAVHRRHCRFYLKGSFGINIPVPKIFFNERSNEVEITIRHDYRSKARHLVAEMMVLAGESVAIYCTQKNIPVPFRSQPTSFCPEHISEKLRNSSYDGLPSFADLYAFVFLFFFFFPFFLFIFSFSFLLFFFLFFSSFLFFI